MVLENKSTANLLTTVFEDINWQREFTFHCSSYSLIRLIDKVEVIVTLKFHQD